MRFTVPVAPAVCGALLTVAALLAGCTSAALSPTYAFERPDRLLAQHASSRAGLQAIQAEARVDQRGDEGRIRGTVLMFVERSGRVRFDVMTQFGPVLTLTSDGQRFALNDKRESKFLHGPACPLNIARLLGLPVSAPEAAVLLLGGVPDLPAATQRLAWRGEDGLYRITRTSPEGLVARMDLALLPEDEKAPLSEQRFRLVGSSLVGPDGHVFWQARYGEFRPVRGAGRTFDMPFKVRVMQPSTDTDTLVRFQEIIPNPSIPAEAFVQAVPAGVEVEEALCE